MKIIEATILYPMTIFIVVMLIGLMMHFYNLFAQQVDYNTDMTTQTYSERVVKYINAFDKAEDLFIR